jgi:hypothetical protein
MEDAASVYVSAMQLDLPFPGCSSTRARRSEGRPAWLKGAGLAASLFAAACAQSPSSEFEHLDDDSTLADGATAAQEGSSEADVDNPSEELDAGATTGTMGEGAGTGAPPAGGVTRDASRPATTPATVRSDAGSEAKPSTSTPTRPAMGASDAAAATAADAATKPADPAPVKPSDPAPRDAGAMPAAGATCEAAAGYPTADACAQCICAKCATQVTACYASNDAAKNTQCGLVQACAEKSHCTSSDCYCGDALLCLGTPTGACVSVIETAAGTQDSIEILRASNDLDSPVGRANQIGMCSSQSCARECGL